MQNETRERFSRAICNGPISRISGVPIAGKPSLFEFAVVFPFALAGSAIIAVRKTVKAFSRKEK
ncbi:MAG: hypothetical protein GXP63_02330 [DPANN group archaeon]|nr:hypothetical protein [DPANN group archaeon]